MCQKNAGTNTEIYNLSRFCILLFFISDSYNVEILQIDNFLPEPDFFKKIKNEVFF